MAAWLLTFPICPAIIRSLVHKSLSKLHLKNLHYSSGPEILVISCVVTYLHPGLAEFEPVGEILAGEHVGVLRLLEGPLQLVQLERGEGRSRATDLLARGRLAVRAEIVLRVVAVLTVF